MPPRLPALPEISLETKVAFLRQATCFSEPTRGVDTVETHMSWVFLTDDYAYKLKKPVRRDAFDFRTPESRHFYCEEEVRLNRRLAPDVYLGVVALAVDATGNLRLDGDGRPVDFLVKMRRLPAGKMLDVAIGNGSASQEDIRRVANRLAVFFRECPPVSIEPLAYRSAFHEGIACNLLELSRPAYQLPVERIARLCTAQESVLDARREWLDRRVLEGRIVEGHGDLRPEHICLEEGLPIIDCLEFSRDLRLLDPADEIGFLALECERLAAQELAGHLLRAYSEISEDRPNPSLVHFYQSYRAGVRARIAIRHLDEERFRKSGKWRRRACEYLALAEAHQASISSVIDPPP